LLKNHRAANRTVHVPDKVFQQQELFRAHIDSLPRTGNSAPGQIQLKITLAKYIDLIRREMWAA
jgi:hypothetical protein